METQTTLKPGDKVRVKTLEQLQADGGDTNDWGNFVVADSGINMAPAMLTLVGQNVTLKQQMEGYWTILEDEEQWCWYPELMFDLTADVSTSVPAKTTPQAERKYYFHHIRTKKKNRLRATVVGVYDENSNLLLSAAVCSKKDQFSRKRGRELAIARLNIYPMRVYHYSKEFLPDEIITKGRFFLQGAQELAEEVLNAPNILIPIPNETKYKTNVTEKKV